MLNGEIILIIILVLIPYLIIVYEEICDKEYEKFLKEVYGEDYDED